MSNLLYDDLFGFHVENDKPFLTYYDGSQISYDAFLRMASRFANVINYSPNRRLSNPDFRVNMEKIN